jgi:hypothetical protein
VITDNHSFAASSMGGDVMTIDAITQYGGAELSC